MKNVVKILMLGFIALGFAFSSHAQNPQVQATATAEGTLITTISITKTVDMNFGNFSVKDDQAGTVVLDPATGLRSKTLGVSLPTFDVGTVAVAEFLVEGQGAYTFAVEIPASGAVTTITREGGSESMDVDSWTVYPASSWALSGGEATIKVGATLHVPQEQAPGVYISGTPFVVKVNYN